MTRALARGNALPETALVVSLAMLLLFGALHEALLGFDQLTADGATFMGAQKSVQLKGSSASLADAQAVVSLLFPGVSSSSVTIATSSSGPSLFETDVAAQEPTLRVPGVDVAATSAIQSRDVEANAGSKTAGVPTLCYSVANGTATFNLGLSSVLASNGQVNGSVLSAHDANVANVQTALTNLPGALTSVVNALVAILDLPIMGPLVQTALGTTPSGAGTYVASLVQPTLNAALTGTATNSQISGLLSGMLSTVSRVLGGLDPTYFSSLSNAITQLAGGVQTLNGAESALAAITGTSGC